MRCPIQAAKCWPVLEGVIDFPRVTVKLAFVVKWLAEELTEAIAWSASGLLRHAVVEAWVRAAHVPVPPVPGPTERKLDVSATPDKKAGSRP